MHSKSIYLLSNYWWKRFTGSPECSLQIYFIISKILPKGQNKLNGEYQLYLIATEKFTAEDVDLCNEYKVIPCSSDISNIFDGNF